jgi:hypothetical protein
MVGRRPAPFIRLVAAQGLFPTTSGTVGGTTGDGVVEGVGAGVDGAGADADAETVFCPAKTAG